MSLDLRTTRLTLILYKQDLKSLPSLNPSILWYEVWTLVFCLMVSRMVLKSRVWIDSDKCCKKSNGEKPTSHFPKGFWEQLEQWRGSEKKTLVLLAYFYCNCCRMMRLPLMNFQFRGSSKSGPFVLLCSGRSHFLSNLPGREANDC